MAVNLSLSLSLSLRRSSHKIAASASAAAFTNTNTNTNRLLSPSSSSSSSSALLPSRRSVHGSVYDKNLDDHIRPTVVPDDIIQPHSDNYWAPNPNTGVFGPASEHNTASVGDRGFHTSSADANANSNANAGSESSVLEQKAFFRPLEDLDKPDPA